MFFFPEVIEVKQSAFNGTIKVYKLFGHYSLSVDHLTQSGGLVKNIWQQGLKKIKQPDQEVKTVLILGFGAGTAAKLINHFWPKASITGIEIDKVVLELAQKYFGLEKINNLKLKQTDAMTFVTKKPTQKYDLVLVDLYHGKSFPHKASGTPFAHNIKQLLNPRGALIINRLNYAHNETEISRHISTLKKVFPQVIAQKVLSNILVFCNLSRYN